MAKLKSCPWCLRNEMLMLIIPGRNKWQVVCKQCKSSGPVSNSPNEAIDAWNRREK